MNKAGKINNIETNSSFIEPYNFTSKDNERLKNIEQMLYIQQQLLQTTGKVSFLYVLKILLELIVIICEVFF